ncbi:chaplin [Streptomyces sp. NPDC052095]|uniref:chaplin n=1 Tax=unclassified Streptomyces TaxID=2593676 RepID=UPI00344EF1BA
MRKALSKSVLVAAAASGLLAMTGGYAFADASADGAAVGSPGVGSGNTVQVPVHVPVNVCGNTVDVVGLLNPAFGNECANVGGQGGGGGQGASAEGAAVGSPGVLSGNVVQVPVDVPVNACGNSVDVIGALNPAGGNHCANVSGGGELPPPVPVVHPPHHPPHHPPVEPPHHPPVEPPHHPPVEPPHHPTPPKPHKPDCPPEHHKPPVHHEPPAPAHHKPPKPHKPDCPPEHHEPPVPVHHEPPAPTPPVLAHTGANGNLGIAGGAAAAMVLGGGLMVRRARTAKD